MSVKQSLLAMLDEGPRYGAQLRSEFETRTGGTWPLNVGQVYTTLARLERDGLVEAGGEDESGHVLYAITPAGRAEVQRWFATPVDRVAPGRDELAIKLAFAVTVPGLDVSKVVGRQRAATVGALQDYTRLKDRLMDDPDELPWLLVLDSLVFAAEAEVRWLDHIEARVARASAQREDRPAPAPDPTTKKALR
jgi:DNA-binding PadR family transcriptional regulator